ncbi:LacI family DNA-binding transcriptional regulator [Microbacterium sp. ZW T5_56]|uniref:LacI family DNA-binding transcriptional regulator n=1 Tax=Microbacterium sp. ZW T5_56 TaxID=3378081 RepID=UPI003853FFF3
MATNAVTMRDVARLAGVSVATVSFVINGSKPVTEETRQRVERAMAEAGYRRNVIARALASKRTRVIGLLYPTAQRAVQGSAFQFFTSAAAQAQVQGYTLVVSPTVGSDAELGELTGAGLIEGLVVMEVHADDARVAYLRAQGVPFALVGRTADVTGIAYVDIDFDETVTDALARLQALGHRDVLLLDTVTDPEDVGGYAPPLRVRSAFGRIGAERGMRTAAFGAARTADAGFAAAGRLVAQHPRVTAVLVHDELLAAGFVAGLRALGVRVPEDLSVGLIDSTPEIASMIDPRLDVWAVPGEELGREGVAALIDVLERGSVAPSAQNLVACRHVAGASLAAPRVGVLHQPGAR